MVSPNPMTLGSTSTITLTCGGTSTPAPAPDPAPGSSGSWTTDVTAGCNSAQGVYGYDESDGIGSMGDRDFVYGGLTYNVSHIKWTDSSDRFELELEQCLKPSVFR